MCRESNSCCDGTTCPTSAPPCRSRPPRPSLDTNTEPRTENLGTLEPLNLLLNLLPLLQLCDSLFPIGAFAYSDGLETAAGRAAPPFDAGELRAWIDVCLDETFGRMEGPAVWQAWTAFRDEDWDTLVMLDEEFTALRPSSSGRRSSRAM